MAQIIVAAAIIASAITAAPDVTLMARAIGWEAPVYLAPEADRIAVASTIRYRMLCRGQSLQDVLFAPGQFSTASLLDTDPQGMESLMPLAAEALQWGYDDLPVKASHFFATTIEPPYWARPGQGVIVPGAVQRYFLIDDCK